MNWQYASYPGRQYDFISVMSMYDTRRMINMDLIDQIIEHTNPDTLESTTILILKRGASVEVKTAYDDFMREFEKYGKGRG